MRAIYEEHNRELTILDAQLQVLDRREADFQKIIDEMQALKTSVEKERQSLQSRKEEVKKMLIPIYRLPPELFLRVFLLFVQADFLQASATPKITSFWAPLTISHVCRSWNHLAISSPELWSYIYCNGGIQNQEMLHESLRRSHASPLHVVYRVFRDIPNSKDQRQVKNMISILKPHFSRLCTFNFQSRFKEALGICLGDMRNTLFLNHSLLKNLTLSIYERATDEYQVTSPYTSTTPLSYQCRVKFLKVENLLPFSIPPQIFADLTTLELSFTSTRSNQQSRLSMAVLCQFLLHTPRLEELVVFDTIPFTTASPPSRELPLLHLRTLEWSNPQARDVSKLLSYFYVPSLTRMDLWLDERSSSASNTFDETFASLNPANSKPHVLEYSQLKELNLQCMSGQSARYTFQKMIFPNLEKLEISLIGDRGGTKGDDGPLPCFPTLVNIFRDPRLPRLTHLTLSSWTIPSDPEFSRVFLGYLPALISLTIEHCVNAGALIQCMQEALIQITSKPVSQQRHIFRVCPKLEALTFWGCNDVEFACLRELVLIRNGRPTSPLCGELNQSPSTLWFDSDSTSTYSRPAESEGLEQKIVESPTKGRVIRPLRKNRRQGQMLQNAGCMGTTQGTLGAATNTLSSIDVISSQPAQILYLRIEDCKRICQPEAESLRTLGVLDVIRS